MTLWVAQHRHCGLYNVTSMPMTLWLVQCNQHTRHIVHIVYIIDGVGQVGNMLQYYFWELSIYVYMYMYMYM